MRSTWLHIVFSFTLAGMLLVLVPGSSLHICLSSTHTHSDCCHGSECASHHGSSVDITENLNDMPCCLEVEAPATPATPSDNVQWKNSLHGLALCPVLFSSIITNSRYEYLYLFSDFPPPPVDVRDQTCRINC